MEIFNILQNMLLTHKTYIIKIKLLEIVNKFCTDNKQSGFQGF